MGDIVRNARGQISSVERPIKVQAELSGLLPGLKPGFLSEGQWEALVLHVREGLSYEEIAEMWDSSANKPKYRARKGSELLRSGGQRRSRREVPEPYTRGERIFGEIGVLDDDGETVGCHVCGRRYAHPGGHVKLAHGMEADDYRREFGLKQSTGLVSSALADNRREHVEHLRTYDQQTSEMMRSWSIEERRAFNTGREIRAEQRLDPGYQEKLEGSLQAARRGLKKAREEGRYDERGWPEEAIRRGQEALRRKREDPEYLRELGRKISKAKGGVSMEDRLCEMCGSAFSHVAWIDRKTCSDVCSTELRSRNMSERKPSTRVGARQKISDSAKKRAPGRDRDAKGRFA